jgi:hypothetical protein
MKLVTFNTATCAWVSGTQPQYQMQEQIEPNSMFRNNPTTAQLNTANIGEDTGGT